MHQGLPADAVGDPSLASQTQTPRRIHEGLMPLLESNVFAKLGLQNNSTFRQFLNH